jgi:purine-nucleoside phosphorylase
LFVLSGKEEEGLKGLYEKIEEAKRYIQKKAAKKPRFALILGTGMGGIADVIKADASIPYGDIPNFVTSTISGHAGNLILGELGGKPVVAMQGRMHFYEGYSMKEITFPVRVMHALGAGELIMSNAVGGMSAHLDRGDIVVMTDQINLMGDNPLIGWNDERLGPRFPDMSEPYSIDRRKLFEAVACEQGIPVRRVVMAAVTGPNLETSAEYRFLKRIGADAVGMSMIPETIVAVHAGMKVLGLGIVTDLCFPDCLKPANIKEIIETASKSEKRLRVLVEQYLKKI